MSIRPQAGVSLVEMMIALLVSAILILGVTDLFSSASMSSRTHSELARIQEEARIAMELIGGDARLAGMQACISDSGVVDWPVDIKPLELGVGGKSLTLRFYKPSTCDSPAPELTTVLYVFGWLGPDLRRFQVNGTVDSQLELWWMLDSLEYYPMPLLQNADGHFKLLPEGSSPETANAVQITINAKSDKANFEARSFSSTYEFKNRVIKRE